MKNSEDFSKIINSLDSRIQKIEKFLSLNSHEEKPKDTPQFYEDVDSPSTSLELQVGHFWLPKIGILVLVVGLLFLVALSFENLPSFLPSLLGFTAAAFFFLMHKFGDKHITHIDNYILIGGFIILFFSTLRLSYFSNDVFINNNFIEIPVLLFVSIALLFYSLKKKSISLASISILFGFITTLLISNSTVALITVLFVSIIVVWIARKFNWQFFILIGIILSYTTYFLWLIGNPFFNNVTETSHLPNASIFFILSNFVIYSIGLIVKDKEQKEELIKIVSIFINSFFAACSFIIYTLANNIMDLSIFSFIAFSVFLLSAIISWFYEKGKYATFFYSILGYMLLSISIISGFQKPEYFILLSWQSLLVVSTAVWFRSRIIIVANFIIYIIIFFSFLFLASKVSYISISFGIVALLSARFLNWKKTELKLNSEGMRNAYLICAFFIFPYSLYNSIPEAYITISWIGVAVLYYILSLVLNNIKYRWLALATLLLSVLYAVFFGIAELSSGLRIFTFIILGIVLLIISILYSKRKSEIDRT